MTTKLSEYVFEFPPVFRLLIAAASVVIIAAGIRTAAPILNPLLLALIIALLLTPLTRWLREKGLPSWLTLLLIIVVIIGLGLLLIGFMGLSLSQLGDRLPAYQARLADRETTLADWLAQQGIDASSTLDSSLVDPGRLVQLTALLIARVGKSLANASLMLIFAIYMLAEATGFPFKLRRVAEPNSRLLLQLEAFTSSVRDYMYIRTAAGAAAAILNVILLLVLGVDFALLWGILSFLMSFIPSIGYLIALIPPVVLAFVELGGRDALIVFFGYWLINGTIDTVLAPRFMGEGLNMSPLVIFASLTVWAWLLGPTGAILAIPLTMMVKQVLLEGFDSTRPLAVLLSMKDEDQETDVMAPLEPETVEQGIP